MHGHFPAQILPGGAIPQRGTVAFFLRSREPVGPTEFPLFRVAFSDQLGEAFYSQLTAEIYDPNRRKWVKVRDRNEVLDLFCLNIAAGYRNDVLGSRLRERELERLQAQLEPEMDLFNAPPPASVQTPAPPLPAAPAQSLPSPPVLDDHLFSPIALTR